MMIHLLPEKNFVLFMTCFVCFFRKCIFIIRNKEISNLFQIYQQRTARPAQLKDKLVCSVGTFLEHFFK